MFDFLESRGRTKKETPPTKKMIKGYEISYCPTEFIGKNLFGELRLGFKHKQKVVYLFRITRLPISPYISSIFKLQAEYSNLKQATRTIYDVVETQSNRYTVIEYFPKSFKSQIDEIRKKTKYMEELVAKFLEAYSVMYHLHIFHGNISLTNICITFDGRVKLTDFRPLDLPFEKGAARDYDDFRNMMCIIMERQANFPAKLDTLNQKDGNWTKLFSLWHIVTPFQFLYVSKKKPYQNMVVLLTKLQASLIDCTFENEKLFNSIKVAIRLLMYSHLKRAQEKDKRTMAELKKLKQILHPMDHHDTGYFNAILWGIIKDPHYFCLSISQRLTLIVCLIEILNHQYFYVEMIREFDERMNESKLNELLGNNLVLHYETVIKSNMIDLS